MTAWRIVLARIGGARAAELAKRSRFAANVASCSRASTRSAAVESWSSHKAMTRSTVASRTGNSARSSIAPAMERAATGSMPSFQGAQSVACFASMALTCIGRGSAPLSGDVVAGRVSEYFPAMTVAFRTCPLCEATCGLALDVDEAAHTVTKVRGDADDVFSHGFLCPKGVSIKELHDDPDRVRTPLVKQPDGSFAPASWDEAFALVADRLPAVMERGGKDAVAAYIGNPAAHSLAFLLYGKVLLKAIGSKNIFSASTVDQYPKQAASALMFGSGTTIAIPDLDRTDYLLCLGANPLASNGSLMTAPDARGRLRAIRARGGTIVVVDPRRSRTAAEADVPLAIRPGTDALLLMALLHVVFAEDLGIGPDHPAAAHVEGLDEVRSLAAEFPPELVADACGLDADAIRAVARDFATAPSG